MRNYLPMCRSFNGWMKKLDAALDILATSLQAPVIMMSQNRADVKDRVRSELKYQVNLKAETEITALNEKMAALREELLSAMARVASYAADAENSCVDSLMLKAECQTPPSGS